MEKWWLLDMENPQMLVLDWYDVLEVAKKNGTLVGHRTVFSRMMFGSRREGWYYLFLLYRASFYT